MAQAERVRDFYRAAGVAQLRHVLSALKSAPIFFLSLIKITGATREDGRDTDAKRRNGERLVRRLERPLGHLASASAIGSRGATRRAISAI